MSGNTQTGVWLAYYNDWSGFSVFKSEIGALRHAIANHMDVLFLPYGADPKEVERKSWQAPGQAPDD